MAVRAANLGHRDRAGGQRSYLHRFETGAAMVVFVDTTTKRVRGYIYNSKNPNRFIEKHLKDK